MARIVTLGSWSLTPAICRAVYPVAGGNHELHVSEQPRGEHRDGYIAERQGVRWFISRDHRDGWGAQRVKDGIAQNSYWAFNYASRAGLLMHLESAPA